ncbi:Fungal specific transcription factor domain-containing protein [Cladophialophora immunda]|nr:Fungal specific transcription factor domain-containing protein [Cladophialophora immunda]
MAPAEIPAARKYRSRKQKPCDNCRRRRICCVRDAEGACALCSRRSIPCTFSSEPSPRKRRARSPTAKPHAPVQDDASEESPGTSANSGVGPHLVVPTANVAEARKNGVDGKYVGLSGTDDVYFVAERNQPVGNDPAHEAYFRERAASSTSVASASSTHRARSIEPTASVVQTIFLERSHPAIPLLDESLIKSQKQSRLLTNAIAIISKYTSPELEGLHNNVLIEDMTAALLLEARSPTLETIEAAILFTQRALRGKMSTSAPGMYAAIGCLVAMCHDLGLNIDCSTWSIPESTKRRRKRLWWAAYMQDKWFAMALGRPSFINASNTTTLSLTAADFEEATSGSPGEGAKRPELVTGIHCFVAMAELTVILNEILSIFFTISSVVSLREVSGEHIIDIAERIESELSTWRSTYLDQILTQRFFPDVTGSLELAYITARIMLLRGIFPKLYRRNFALDRYVERAVETTTHAITLVETLQINRLSAFWWSCSGFNLALAGTFMASLKRLSPNPDRATYWAGRLKYYRTLLAAHGFSFWPAKFAAMALNDMAKSLTKATEAGARAAVAPTSLSSSSSLTAGGAGAGAGAATEDTTPSHFDAFTSPLTTSSGVSYDFFPHSLTELNGPDFYLDLWSGGDVFQWEPDPPADHP